jgi:hypothetical protein
MSNEVKRMRKEAVVTFSKVLTLAFALAGLRYVTKSFSYGSWCRGENWDEAPPLEPAKKHSRLEGRALHN